MKSTIEDSTKIFFEDILGLKVTQAKTLGKNFYCASIPIYQNSLELNWFIFFKKPTIKKIAQILLLEDDIDEDGIDDLLKEVSNQIIGLAKVKLEEKNPNISYRLGTPEFLGNISAPIPLKLSNNILHKVCNRTFLIAQKAQNG